MKNFKIETIILGAVGLFIVALFASAAIQIHAGFVCYQHNFMVGQYTQRMGIVCSQPVNAPNYTCLLDDVIAGKCP